MQVHVQNIYVKYAYQGHWVKVTGAKSLRIDRNKMRMVHIRLEDQRRSYFSKSMRRVVCSRSLPLEGDSNSGYVGLFLGHK